MPRRVMLMWPFQILSSHVSTSGAFLKNLTTENHRPTEMPRGSFSQQGNPNLKKPKVRLFQQSGQASLTSVLLLLALIVGGVWGWNHLSFDARDIIIEDVIPVLLVGLFVGVLIWRGIKTVQNRKHRRQRRDQLMEKFKQERSRQKKFEVVVDLVELNNYELTGLEPLATEMAEVCVALFKRSIGDKQHRIRGIAASHLGVLQHRDSIPLLMRALEDDHAYVRSSAALALGRMRAVEAKEKLEYTMKEDWDQTVRSRSREAVDRMS